MKHPIIALALVMVTRSGARNLMALMWDISYLYERSRSASAIYPLQTVAVKGENYILQILKRSYTYVEYLASNYPGIGPLKDEMRDWIAYLDKKYVDTPALLGPPVNLDAGDGKKLSEDSVRWREIIMEVYSKQGTILIHAETLDQLLPDSLTSMLDQDTKDDLKDGINAILHLMPTPGAMMLFRASEGVVRKFYTKITGTPAGRKSWYDLLTELEATKKVKPTLIGYLHYIRDRRNEAEHPDRHFTQEEAETVLLHLKEIIIAVNK